MKSSNIIQPALFDHSIVTFNKMAETRNRALADSDSTTETFDHSLVKVHGRMVTSYQMMEQGNGASANGNQMPETVNGVMVTSYRLPVNSYQTMGTLKNRKKTLINYTNN